MVQAVDGITLSSWDEVLDDARNTLRVAKRAKKTMVSMTVEEFSDFLQTANEMLNKLRSQSGGR